MRHGDKGSGIEYEGWGRVNEATARQFLMEETMRHGDSKTEFSTGAKRDTAEGKGRPSLISPVLIHRLGVLLEKGAEHYGANNWMKGMPYRRTMDSVIRHVFQWLAGDEEEDHLAAVCFGAMCLMHYEADTALDLELDDRCEEEMRKILPSILTPPLKDATVQTDGGSVAEVCDREAYREGGPFDIQ